MKTQIAFHPVPAPRSHSVYHHPTTGSLVLANGLLTHGGVPIKRHAIAWLHEGREGPSTESLNTPRMALVDTHPSTWAGWELLDTPVTLTFTP